MDNTDNMKYANKMYGAKLPIEYGYHGKGFNDLNSYHERYATLNGCTIFCNSG